MIKLSRKLNKSHQPVSLNHNSRMINKKTKKSFLNKRMQMIYIQKMDQKKMSINRQLRIKMLMKRIFQMLKKKIMRKKLN